MKLSQEVVAGLDPTEFASLEKFRPESSPSVQRWVTQLGRDSSMEALGVNKDSETLVVSLHGATNRNKFTLPRFEWLHTLSTGNYSSLYFSDPTLRVSKELELGWYTGWPGFNGHFWIAEWSRRVAQAFGCTKIIFAGSSGGGMASLQAATYVPESMALVFNPQTSIIRYLVGGERDHAQRRYFQGVVPHLLPGGWATKNMVDDWTQPLGDVASPVRRYSVPRPNYVYYVQNENDLPHVDGHYHPFKEKVEKVLSREALERRFHFELYSGPTGHVVPTREEYLQFLDNAITWFDLGSRGADTGGDDQV